jgi:hypothetical protein
MGAACSDGKQLSPPGAPQDSTSGSVSDILGDGRLLADYIVFLKETGNVKDLTTVQAYEFELGDQDALESSLQASWKAYKASPAGFGNFDDTSEWTPHALPHQDIADALKASSPHEVDEEHEMYSFSLAAMVGINVATVCSRIAHEACPNGTVLDGGVRRYKIPVAGSAYSPKTSLKDAFEIEEFAPEMFLALRAKAGVSDEDFKDSVCRTDFHYIEFGSNSKSGEFFFFTHDMKYLIKTMAEEEAETLLDMVRHEPTFSRGAKLHDRPLFGPL